MIRSLYDRKAIAARTSSGELGEAPSVIYRRLRLEMLAAERETLVGLRDAGRINDEVLSRTLRDLDLEEAMLTR